MALESPIAQKWLTLKTNLYCFHFGIAYELYVSTASLTSEDELILVYVSMAWMDMALLTDATVLPSLAVSMKARFWVRK